MVRDIGTIYDFTKELCLIWKEVPHWSFGQFVENFVRYEKEHKVDLFNASDEKCLRQLNNFVEWANNKKY